MHTGLSAKELASSFEPRLRASIFLANLINHPWARVKGAGEKIKIDETRGSLYRNGMDSPDGNFSGQSDGIIDRVLINILDGGVCLEINSRGR